MSRHRKPALSRPARAMFPAGVTFVIRLASFDLCFDSSAEMDLIIPERADSSGRFGRHDVAGFEADGGGDERDEVGDRADLRAGVAVLHRLILSDTSDASG